MESFLLVYIWLAGSSIDIIVILQCYNIYVIYRIGGPYREIFLEVLKTARGRGTFLRPREIFLYTDRSYR